MFPALIETERLRFERIDEAVTARQFYAAAGAGQTDSIEEETEWVSWEPHPHPKESYDVLELFREQWEEREGANYAVIPREGEPGSGTLAGNTGVGFDWDTRKATLGIWLRKPFWGRGYSGERAAALAELVFERLDLDLLATEVIPANEKSIRAVERYVDRLGGRREGRFRNRIVPEGGEPRDTIRFSVSAEEYAAATAADDGVGEEVVTLASELDEPTLAGRSPAAATQVDTADEAAR